MRKKVKFYRYRHADLHTLVLSGCSDQHNVGPQTCLDPLDLKVHPLLFMGGAQCNCSTFPLTQYCCNVFISPNVEEWQQQTTNVPVNPGLLANY